MNRNEENGFRGAQVVDEPTEQVTVVIAVSVVVPQAIVAIIGCYPLNHAPRIALRSKILVLSFVLPLLGTQATRTSPPSKHSITPAS